MLQPKKLLKSIINNKSLCKIFLSKNQLGDESSKLLKKIVSRPKPIESFSLYNNSIKRNDNLLRIISRTKIILSPIEKKRKIKNKLFINKNRHILNNLDVSFNPVKDMSQQKVSLFSSLIDEIDLTCLDYSQIILGYTPAKYDRNSEYYTEAKKIRENLEKKLNEQNDLLNKIKSIDNQNKIIKNEIKNNKFINNEKLKKFLLEIKDIDNEKSSLINILKSYEFKEILADLEKDINSNEEKEEIEEEIIKAMDYILFQEEEIKRNEKEIKNLESKKNNQIIII